MLTTTEKGRKVGISTPIFAWVNWGEGRMNDLLTQTSWAHVHVHCTLCGNDSPEISSQSPVSSALEVLTPSVLQLCTLKSTGHYKILCKGDFGSHGLFVSVMDDMSLYEGLRMLRCDVIKMLSNVNRMYRSHEECSQRVAYILITTTQLWDALGSCSRNVH